MKSLTMLLHQHRFRLLVVLFLFLAIDLGLMIVPVEQGHPQANITSVEDGVWWSVTTMTGVGFGDLYPVTLLGRVLGVVLEVLGVVVFGLIVGHIAVALFRVRDDYYWKKLFRRLDAIEERVQKIEKSQKFVVEEANHRHGMGKEEG